MPSWRERVWYGGGRGGAWLRPLAALFGLLVRARGHAYRRGWLAAVRGPRPVVVVGNLSVGGSGKTPFVAWLAARLEERGIPAGIVSRGYRGTAPGARPVDARSDPPLPRAQPGLRARPPGVP